MERKFSERRLNWERVGKYTSISIGIIYAGCGIRGVKNVRTCVKESSSAQVGSKMTPKEMA